MNLGCFPLVGPEIEAPTTIASRQKEEEEKKYRGIAEMHGLKAEAWQYGSTNTGTPQCCTRTERLVKDLAT